MINSKTAIFIFLASICLGCNKSEANKEKPTIYLIGDSTVKNGKGKGDGGLWGWGDFIIQHLDTANVSVENHALGGTSSRTFKSKGIWQPVKDKLKKGDYLFIQFGHNDSGPINDDFRARGTIKGVGDEKVEIDNMLTGKHEIVHTYGWYIKKYIQQANQKGAIPIVISPIPRNNWENGKVPRNDTSYGLWAKEIAENEKVPFIDLNEKMSLEMEKLGADKVTGTYFYKHDHTHTTAKGAVLAASLVINGLKNNNLITNAILDNPTIIYPPKKNIYIIGDSTVASGNDSIVGWGLPIESFFDTTRVNIINKARGGRSSRTFYYEGLWDSIKQKLKPEDFVIIQFGHNDGGNIDMPKYRGSLKGTGEQVQEVTRPDNSKEVVHTYGWYLRKYIHETKSKGAIPIVLSQVSRNKWDNGKVERVNEDYGKWAKESADHSDAFFIDLNDSIAIEYEKMGEGKIKDFFPIDHTHTNSEGAALNASIIARAIKNLKKCTLKDYVINLE